MSNKLGKIKKTAKPVISAAQTIDDLPAEVLEKIPQEIRNSDKRILAAIRVMIAASGALKYAAFEYMPEAIKDYRKIFPHRRVAASFDIGQDLKVLNDKSMYVAQKLRHRYMDLKVHANYEDLDYALFKIFDLIGGMEESKAFEVVTALASIKDVKSELVQEIEHIDKILETFRRSNHDAIKLLEARRESQQKVLEEIKLKMS